MTFKELENKIWLDGNSQGYRGRIIYFWALGISKCTERSCEEFIVIAQEVLDENKVDKNDIKVGKLCVKNIGNTGVNLND